jgi:hypothetical protein
VTGTTNTAGSTTVSGAPSAAITGVVPTGKENVQITNLGLSEVNLAGFSVTTKDGTKFTLPSTQLKSGSDITVFFGVGTNDDSASYLNSQNNDVLDDVSGTVTLTNNDGDKVSTLSYNNVYSSNGSNGSKTTTTTSSPATTPTSTTASSTSASR